LPNSEKEATASEKVPLDLPRRTPFSESPFNKGAKRAMYSSREKGEGASPRCRGTRYLHPSAGGKHITEVTQEKGGPLNRSTNSVPPKKKGDAGAFSGRTLLAGKPVSSEHRRRERTQRRPFKELGVTAGRKSHMQRAAGKGEASIWKKRKTSAKKKSLPAQFPFRRGGEEGEGGVPEGESSLPCAASSLRPKKTLHKKAREGCRRMKKRGEGRRMGTTQGGFLNKGKKKRRLT